MTKAEIISQLRSLRDSTIDYMKGNNDPIFKKDVEALDAVIDFLNQVDHKVSPNDALVPDCVPVIRCKNCKFSRELRPRRYAGKTVYRRLYLVCKLGVCGNAGGLLFKCKTEEDLSPVHSATTHGCMSAMATITPAMNPTATESNVVADGHGNTTIGRKQEKMLLRHGMRK